PKLNPYNVGHGSFVYGTLPVLLAHWTGKLVGKTGDHGAFLVGRVLSAIFDLVSVWLVYRIARRLAGRRTALAAAAFLAGSPMAIQLSHFWTVDTFLATFSTAALLGAGRLAQGRRDAATLAPARAATSGRVGEKRGGGRRVGSRHPRGFGGRGARGVSVRVRFGQFVLV